MSKTFDSLVQSVYPEVAQLTQNSVDREAKVATRHSVYFEKVGGLMIHLCSA